MGIHLTAIANHNFRFETPEAGLRQLSERTGLPAIITPELGTYSDLDWEMHQGFSGWKVTPHEPDFDTEFRKEGCFHAFLTGETELLIGSHFFAGFEPEETGRWIIPIQALLKPTGDYKDQYRDDTIAQFNELRFRLYRFVKRMGGEMALYFASSKDCLMWEGFRRHYNLLDVLNVARRVGYPVFRYPEDKALMATLPYEGNGFEAILVDRFVDFAHHRWD